MCSVQHPTDPTTWLPLIAECATAAAAAAASWCTIDLQLREKTALFFENYTYYWVGYEQ